MKKIVSLFCLICLLTTVVLFAGCGCNSDVPPDHQLASDPTVDGYTLYIPEEWQFVRTNDVITAHVSTVNTMAFTAARVTTEHTDMNLYWQESEAELIAMMGEELSDPEDPESPLKTSYKLENSGSTLLEADQGGNLAFFYEYTGLFPTKLVRYRVIQYFILLGVTPADGMVVLTLSGSDEVKETTGDKDFNDNMREKLTRMLEVIVMGEKTADAADKDLAYEDKNAPEGMKNATLNRYLGMTVYVPDTWRVEESDGFIGVVSPDGYANIGITNLSLTGGIGIQTSMEDRMKHYGIEYFDEELGFTLIDYWNLSKAEYTDFFDDGTFRVTLEPVITETEDEDGNKTYDIDHPPTEAGESTYYTYHFSGEYRGEVYEVTFYAFRATIDRKNQFRTLTLMTHGATHANYVSVAEKILREVQY